MKASDTGNVSTASSAPAGNGTIVVSTNPDTYKAAANSTEVYASSEKH